MVPSRREGSLFRKYVAALALLVTAALLVSGLLDIYFSFDESKAALSRIEREKAANAALLIQQFVADVERQLGWAHLSPRLDAPVTLEQRRDEYLRLLRQAPAVTEVFYLSPSGSERLRISRLALTQPATGADYSTDERFLVPRGGQTYFGPVYFRYESEPYMTIAVAEPDPRGGVTVAEVSLKFMWEVVARLRIGEAGYAYVVDQRGQLIAHPDISLVLQKTSFAGLPQVQAALATPARSSQEPHVAFVAPDFRGRPVLTAYEPIAPPGWTVLVDQPLEEAFAPIVVSVTRTLLLLALGVLVAVLASLALARRMVRPIHALQRGAAHIGAGALDQRIEVRTGDELEALAEEFNRMTAKLRESYTTLEQKVAERTRELARSVEELRALGAVSQAVNSTLDLQTVLTTVVEHAMQLSGTEGGAIYEFDATRQVFELRATLGISPERIATARAMQIHPGETVIGQAAARRAAVQVPDLGDVPGYPFGALLWCEGYRALLAVPLLREDEVIGALVVRRKTPGAFAPATVALLQTFANQSALAIQNARLFQQLEDKSRQLEIASQHKSEFLANMSHELRTPLNAIIGFSDVLLEQMFGPLNEKQADYLRDILDSGRHLLALINDILDLSKIEAGHVELERDTFSLSEVLENGVTMVKERASRHGIALALAVDPRLGHIYADERKLKQVVFNLLSNAVKFTPDGGRVTVSARREADAIVVAVHDTGIGIPPAEQARIFEAFQQVRGPGTGPQEGTGLGLALVKRFVELHGGRVGVESAVGVGSTFTVTLPLVTVEPPAAVAPAPSPAAPARASGTVLVVEDDASALALLTLYLTNAGFQVVPAGNGEEALRLARLLLPGAITLDICLPRVDGWELLARLKADPALAAIPVVVVSMLGDRGKGFALGAAEYLVKPMDRDRLLAALHRLVARPPAKVLVIDDDPLATALVADVLAREGYTVLQATSGEEGLALALHERPALVVLDLLMPGLDGFAVVERLQTDPRTAAVPIVVLTSRVMTAADKTRLNGHISFLAEKNEFQPDAFVAFVRQLCPRVMA